MKVELAACRAALAAVPPPLPPKSPVKPVLGVGAAVLSTVLLSVSLAADLPESFRLPLAGVGLAGIGGAVFLVWP